MKYQTDVAIIGAGPAGLFSIFECGMVGLKCHVIDALVDVGGQCAALYPEKPIYDIPAYPEIFAGQLVQQLEEQARPFAPVFHMGQQVVSLEGKAGEWHLTTSKAVEIEAKIVIIAAGVGAFGPKRPPLEGIESFENESVFYYVREREKFRNKTLMIAGGGDSALDWAINLANLAKHVYLIHRRDKFRAAPESVNKLHALVDEGKITLMTPYQLHALEGQNGLLSAINIQSLDGEIKRVPIDVLLAFFGLSMELGPILEWGLHLDKLHIAIDPRTCETSVPGILAVGDVATYERKLKLILTGFAEAAQAAHYARELIFPDQHFHFEYSTTSGVPKA